jgi:prepilin-type processing-associated H-X9-DG protein
LSKAKIKGQAITCMNNQKQVALAWKLYIDDNLGNFPPNADESNQNLNSWCDGWLKWAADTTDNTNWGKIVSSYCGRYIANQYKVFKCPGDRWLCQENGVLMARVRSISMNGYIGQEADEITPEGGCNLTDWGGSGAGYQAYEKENQVVRPSPSMLWLTVDENADSINDAFFMFSMTKPAFGDGPANYHNGSCSFSFVDGHSELHRWQQLSYWPDIKQAAWGNNINEPGSGPDVQWMVQRTSAKMN